MLGDVRRIMKMKTVFVIQIFILGIMKTKTVVVPQNFMLGILMAKKIRVTYNMFVDLQFVIFQSIAMAKQMWFRKFVFELLYRAGRPSGNGKT